MELKRFYRVKAETCTFAMQQEVMMSGKILALEESELHQAELRLALESPGHQLHSTESLYGAMDYLKTYKVDIIISDVHLENVSAFEFLRGVKAYQPAANIPFLFYCIEPSPLAKSFFETIKVSAQKLGATDVVYLEHFDAAKLCLKIESYLPPGIERKCSAA